MLAPCWNHWVWKIYGTNRNYWYLLTISRYLKACFKNELENCYAQKWIKEINDLDRHPILRTYIGFKNKFCQEKYIERLNIRKYQRAISRFRVSSHRLGIETGRHQKPSLPPDKRLCKYCKSGKVDDELHFLVHCDFHSKIRKLFYSQLCEIISDFHRLKDVDKFREILMSTNEDVIVSLGKFIYDGFKSRDQICINTSWNVCTLIACFIPILWFLISCLLFTAWSFIKDITYCLNYSRHHKGVMVSAWQISIYTLVLPIYVLFLCAFTCVVWLMGQLWPFCVNKMTTTTTTIVTYACLCIFGKEDFKLCIGFGCLNICPQPWKTQVSYFLFNHVVMG